MILHWKSYLIKEEKKYRKEKKKQNFHISGKEKVGRHISKKKFNSQLFLLDLKVITPNCRKMYKFSLSSEIFHHPPIGSNYQSSNHTAKEEELKINSLCLSTDQLYVI